MALPITGTNEMSDQDDLQLDTFPSKTILQPYLNTGICMPLITPCHLWAISASQTCGHATVG